MTNFLSLAALGWQPFFQQQLSLDEWTSSQPARIIEQHKSMITVATEHAVLSIPLQASFPSLVVGDWILLDENQQFVRLLERKTCFKRKASGTSIEQQLISSNVDTAFIVCSANEDFNLNRLERYLALAYEAQVTAVVILSKCDLTDSSDAFVEKIQHIDKQLPIETVNCLNHEDVEKLKLWINTGETLVLLGSSGVGKSTLANTLLGVDKQKTSHIREDDSKGRHTTTRRSLLAIPTGGLILDTPGMREIQLLDCKQGIAATFEDIEKLSLNCKYKDCQHQAEPECAVREAITQGKLDKRRLQNYQKLLKEETLNSMTLAQRRSDDRALGKYYKRTLKASHTLKGR